MRMHIDPTWRHNMARGINDLFGFFRNIWGNVSNDPSINCYIGNVGVSPGAINDCSPANHDVMHWERIPTYC
ncbi:MAG: hypothetical protein RL576_1324 [Actinomycetota bacterium]